MVFKDPWILLLVPVVLVFIYWMKKRETVARFRFPSQQLVKDLPLSLKTRFTAVPFILRLIALVLFIIALAGPRLVEEETIVESEGIDIVLVIDVSGSMAAEDFELNKQRVNRLTIVKDVVEDFIEQRKTDRLGLVVFGAQAYTVCPLTTDYSWLIENLKRLELGIVADQSTAIGSAMVTAVGRLKESKATSKVIVLLTDGVNNAGSVDPVSAAKAAQVFGIKIYTIGAGSKGVVPLPVGVDPFGRKIYQRGLVDIDEAILKEVAKISNGQYYRATDTASLRKIYQEIDELERTKIEEHGYFEYKELFVPFLLFALFLLLVEIVLTKTIFLRNP
ncbi:MAG: VWA domain-containing protein [Candidatus Omnitrophica bacterium]|nr:VWA domain-containing protein [Candidatus Omnitrophota bacterium]